MNTSAQGRRFRYVGSRSQSEAAFPLTPALSLGERVNGAQSLDNSWRASLTDALTGIPPLPKGEGWGEGEQATLPSRPFDLMECSVSSNPSKGTEALQ
jgi:hypothetical protein